MSEIHKYYIKNAICWMVMVVGCSPIAVWIGYAIYMFYLGPRIGWLSHRFFEVEGQSFIALVAVFVGIPLAAFADFHRPKRPC